MKNNKKIKKKNKFNNKNKKKVQRNQIFLLKMEV